jgi:pimeloyl-ACP methyl ester carboxylesterase
MGGLVAGALAASPLQIAAQTRGATSDPVLDIAEWTYYWYGIEQTLMARGTAVNGRQIYVEHWIPRQVRHPYPVVLIHGGNRQAVDWMSTPDGRRGWVSQFIEAGYKVYIVDRPGQGRVPYHPFLHGNYAQQAPTFEAAAASVRGTANLHTQWPGTGDPASPEIMQFAAAACQALPRNAVTQETWSTRGVMLLEEIGPAIFVTHGDGSAFAWGTAALRPDLVKGIVAVEQSANSLQGIAPLAKLAPVRIAIVTSEASPAVGTDPGIVNALRQAGCTVEHVQLASRNIRGNGPFPHLEKNNREVLRPILEWMVTNPEGGVAYTPTAGIDPTRNVENTGMKLADQGHFWVGVQRKQMQYGTIPMGQMFVQYMIPENPRPLPIVMVHGGGGQGTHMMGIGRRPGWVHYFVQNGYSVYWVDRPSYGRATYQPDALGPSHLPIVPAYEFLITSTAVFNTAQWPGPGGMKDPLIDQFMAVERGNVSDENLHSNLVWPGGAELVDRIGPCLLFCHAFGGFFGWGVADRRPDLVKGIVAMEINSNPFAGQFRWGLTAAPMTYDPPVSDPAEFNLVNVTPPPDSPRPVVSPYRLQAEPARKWKNLQRIPISWVTSEYGGGGSPVAQVAFLKQVGCQAEMLRLRDYGIIGNGNLMLMEKNNHEVYRVVQDWLDRNVPSNRRPA